MRNFDERKAEIFRRSENRIKKRKKNRKRILTLCIPLGLCIAILSVLYLPDMMITRNKNNNAADMDTVDVLEDISGFAFTSLEITNNIASSGNSKTENDISNIENIYNIIQSSFVSKDESQDDVYDQYADVHKGESSNKYDANDEKHSSANQSGSTSQNHTKELCYTIAFNADNGTQTVYTLDGNILTNQITKQAVTLTDSQLSKLQMALE